MITVESLVAYSSRPDLVAPALEARAAAPEFGITRGYFELWHKVILERDYPRLVGLDARMGRPNLRVKPVVVKSCGKIAAPGRGDLRGFG